MMNGSDYQEIISMLAANSGKTRPVLTDQLSRFFAESESLNRAIYPDDRTIIEEICKNIDSEIVDSVAIAKIANVDSVLIEIGDPSFTVIHKAVSESLSNSTVTYYDPNDLSDSIATGVLIKIGERVFVATTAHSLPLRPLGRIEIASQTPTALSTIRPNILSSGRPDNSEAVDVAYFEVEPTFVSERLGKSPISLERVMPCGPGHANHATFVFGYPASLITKKQESVSAGGIQFNGQCWGFPNILTPEDWRFARDEGRAMDVEVDAFIAYDRTSEIRRDGMLSDDKLALPHGMSGGGWWQRNSSLKATVWSAEWYGLIAIQCSWPDQDRYLRATQIHHWLRLLGRDFDDVHEILPATFPHIFGR